MSRFLSKQILTSSNVFVFSAVSSFSIFWHTHITTIAPVSGTSMSPTLSPDFHTTSRTDYVLVHQYEPSLSLLFTSLNPWSARTTPLPHARATLQRGDVIAFGKPHDPSGAAIKRVVALGGDKVIRHQSGKRRDREASCAKKLGLGILPDEVTVPPNHIWVESDNYLDDTVDSNVFGPIPANLVIGKVDRIIWPWSRIGTINSRTRRKGLDETQ